MTKKLTAILSVAIILLAGCGAESSPTGEKNPAEKDGKIASVITVQKQTRPVTLTATAVAVPKQEAGLCFSASGTIKQINVVKGDRVGRGQLLAVLDTGTEESRSIKQLQLEEARRELAQKKTDLQRSETLYSQGAISRVDLEERRREVERAASDMAQIEQNIEDVKLLAPFAGTVVEVNNQAGEIAMAGQAIIRLVDLSQVKLTLDVPEDLIEQYKPGQNARVLRESGKTEQGKVTSLAPVVDAGTGKYRVEVTVHNANEEWRGGMLARVEVPRTLITGIVLPLSCVGINQDKRYVLVVENGLAQKRQVQVGQVMEDSIEILSGLRTGEKVISAGIAYIMDGEKIAAKGD